MLLRLLLCLLAVSLTHAVRSLSDPLNLNPTSAYKRYHFEGNSTGPGANNDRWNQNYVQGYIWPIPQKEARQRDTWFTLDPKNFDFRNAGEQSDVLMEALDRYKDLTFPQKKVLPLEAKYPQMLKLTVVVLQKYAPMELKMDESYTLTVDAPESTLKANTVWGALRGLETFSQLVHQFKPNTYWANKNHIEDFPRFQHRGFMIDTSRHYINIKFILQFIDALAYSKFNVLHWHVSDNEAFPYASKRFPQMAQRASHDPVNSVYNADDIKTITEYGRFRGVRVIPEFDTPGHVNSWLAIPDLLTPCYSHGKPNGNHGDLNPTLEKNYKFLKEFFEEVGTVFADKFIHLGGDEVQVDCWKSNPQIGKWMQEHGMGTNYSLLFKYYEQRLTDIVGGLGKKYLVWEDVIDYNVKVKPDTVVNLWYGAWDKKMDKFTKMGYDVILSSCWYLNYISYGDDWHNYYNCDPHNWSGTKKQKDKVIGGTACMWGEYVDGVNLISRSWGRGMFVGGRLWHAKEHTGFYDAATRTWEHGCRYLRRGINADVTYGDQYCRHEYMNPVKDELKDVHPPQKKVEEL